jgi:hypothetical protein
MTHTLNVSRDAAGGVRLTLDDGPAFEVDAVQLALQLLAVLDLDDVVDVAWFWGGAQQIGPTRDQAGHTVRVPAALEALASLDPDDVAETAMSWAWAQAQQRREGRQAR